MTVAQAYAMITLVAPQDKAACKESGTVSDFNVNFEVVRPVGEPKVKPEPAAPGISDLSGKTVCQVWNAGFRADQIFSALTELLEKRFPGVKVIPWTELPTASPRYDVDKNLSDLREAYLQKGCDAVITATGG